MLGFKVSGFEGFEGSGVGVLRFRVLRVQVLESRFWVQGPGSP